MLARFEFSNFRSFHKPAVLSLAARSYRELTEHVVRLGNERVLPVAAVFGPNSSGKSNVLAALQATALFVASSFDSERSQVRADALNAFDPFRFSPGNTIEPMRFEVTLVGDEADRFRVYKYGFTLRGREVLHESLLARSKSARSFTPVFVRDSATLDLSGLPGDVRGILERLLKPSILLLSAGGRLGVDSLNSVQKMFDGMLPFATSTPMEDLARDFYMNRWLGATQLDQARLYRYLSAFDAGISVDKPLMLRPDETGERQILVGHAHPGTGETVYLPLEQESMGTQKMLSLFPFLLGVIESGSIGIADELSARLHPELMHGLLELFLDPALNPKHAQLLFTTHETALLDMDLLRRDEIWFTEKDENDLSSRLYTLADIKNAQGKTRHEYNYQKRYRAGLYSAWPKIGAFDMLQPEPAATAGVT